MSAQRNTNSEQRPTSNVLAVHLRVAGPVITDVRPHAIGTLERQATARIGDVLIYLTDPPTAARIRQQWDASQYIAVKRLPDQAPHCRPALDPYPLGVTVRPDGEMRIGVRWVTGGRSIGVPPYLRVRVGRLLWQVCDLEAWRTIGDAWFDAQRYLDQ